MRRRLIQLLTVVLVGLAGLVATGTAAQAVQYPTVTANSPDGGRCTLGATTESLTFNHPGAKRFHVSSLNSPYTCALRIFLRSDSNAYSERIFQPGSYGYFDMYSAVHRVRVCQSGKPGACSQYLWWDKSKH
jgi:hypothetical protein